MPATSRLRYERVVIVGVGLLGGSLGKALLQRQLARHVIGVGRNPQQLAVAVALGAITEAADDMFAACASADAVVVCTPVQQVVHLVTEVLRVLPTKAWITDVGSTKGSICNAMEPGQHERFCGSHPLAGSDKSGVDHAEADLFQGKLTLVTPTADTPQGLVERVELFWESVGSRTARMTPEEHDMAVARTSHLPHVAAAALAGMTPDSLLPLAASGWCDTTRVAAGNVEMWRQIMCENRQPLLGALRDYSAVLSEWIEALEKTDHDRLLQLLKTGKQQRDSVGN